MNDKVFIACISWLKPNEGGRKQPIPMEMEKYCPIVSIDGEKIFSGSSYGLLCYSFKKIDDYQTLAHIRFLNTKDAPDKLYIGAKIELYEGEKIVAMGKVIQDSKYKFKF